MYGVDETTQQIMEVEKNLDGNGEQGDERRNSCSDVVTVAAQKNSSEVLTLCDAKSSPKKEIPSTIWEDMDEEVLQDHAQAVVEELQKRGACTTLALAKMIGMEKSTELNPLLYLLQEKNVILRVTDIPPIWSLSPEFPMSRVPVAAEVVQVAQPAQTLAQGNRFASFGSEIAPKALPSPLSHPGPESSLPSAGVHPSAQVDTKNAVAKLKFPRRRAHRNPNFKPIITFPPIPPEPETVGFPVATTATPHALQQISADYWRDLNQNSNGKDNRVGGN